MATFTTQHYEQIADAIRRAREHVRAGRAGLAGMDYTIIKELEDMFERDNPEFNRPKFASRVYLEP